MSVAEREVGIDVAKVLAMFFVILHHVSDYGISMDRVSPSWLTFVWAYVHSIAYSCIDLFALATGYLCVSSRCQYSRLLGLVTTAFFWGLVMLLMCDCVLGFDVPLKNYIRALFPIWGRQYWFLTAYFMLFLFMPLLNCGLRNLSRVEYNRLLIVILVFMGGYSLFGIDPFGLAKGASFLWLLSVYLFGAYWRLNGLRNVNPLVCVGVALVLAGICSLRQLVSAILGIRIPGVSFPLVSHMSPLTLAIAFLFFIACLKISCKNIRVNRIIRCIVRTTFGIYLIHTQGFFWHHVFERNLHRVSVTSIWQYVVIISVATVTLFVALAIIEHIRLWLFESLKIPSLLSRIDVILPRKAEWCECR